MLKDKEKSIWKCWGVLLFIAFLGCADQGQEKETSSIKGGNKMASKITVPLLDGWVEETKPEHVVRTFFRNTSRNGPFQVSWTTVAAGQKAEVSEQKLKEMASKFGAEKFGVGEPKDTSSGKCALGNYGTAVFSKPPDRCHLQVWILSNGSGFLLATHMSAKPPDPVEVEETMKMILNITYNETQ